MLDLGSLIYALVPGFFALAGALFMWCLKKGEARSERTWNVRKLGYSSVLAKLKEASEAADIVDRGFHGEERGFGPHDYFGSSAHVHEEEAAAKAWASCKLEFNVNQLIVSDEFSAEFERLLESLPTNHDEYDPPEEASRRSVCLRRAYSDLLPLARHELFSS